MSKLATLTLKGASRKKYDFNVYPIGTTFARVAAVYAVTNRTRQPDGGYRHKVIYIGQTGNLPERFDDHHKAACFQRHSANCICVHRDGNERSRRVKESDLIKGYDPPCND